MSEISATVLWEGRVGATRRGCPEEAPESPHGWLAAAAAGGLGASGRRRPGEGEAGLGGGEVTAEEAQATGRLMRIWRPNSGRRPSASGGPLARPPSLPNV